MSSPHLPCPACDCGGRTATFELKCSVCGELRWPVLHARPAGAWTCARCRAASPGRRQARRAAAVKGRRTRLRTRTGLGKASVTSLDDARRVISP